MRLRISGDNGVAGGRVTPGALSGHRYPAVVIDALVVIGKGAMTGSAIPATIATANGGTVLAQGCPQQTPIDRMTRGAGLMGLGIAGNNRAAALAMATRTVAVHADHGAVVHGERMIVGKAAMTGPAVIRVTAGGALLSRRRINKGTVGPVTLGAGIMDFIVCGAGGNAGYSTLRPAVTVNTV